MKSLISIVIAVMVLPSAVHAQAYKCQSPHGSVSFQQSPCPDNSAGSAIKLAPVQERSPKEAQP